MTSTITLPKGISTVVDEAYRAASVFSVLDSSLTDLKPTQNVNEFCYPYVTTGGLGDYDRNAGYTVNSGVSITWVTAKADYDRGTRFMIDEVDNQETFDIALAGSQAALLRDNVGVIAGTNITAVLVEVCFVDRREDYDAYMKKSYASMTRAICDGLEQKTYEETAKVGWVCDEDNHDLWWYQNADGSYPHDEWKYIDDTWYYFGDDGYIRTGWIELDDHWYYCNSVHNGTFGAMWSNRWIGHNGKWYFLGYDGHMLTDRIIRDEKGNLYALGEDGAVLEGELTICTGEGGRLKAYKRQ